MTGSGSRPVALFVLRDLYVPHTRLERAVRSFPEPVARAVLLRPGTREASYEWPRAARAALAEDDDLLASLESGRWVASERVIGSIEHGVLVALFGAEGAKPRVALKLRPLTPARALQREHDRLYALRGRLPHGLAVTLPRPLGYADGDGWEALLLPWMSGRSPYVEMQSSLRPHRSVRAHLQAAVGWLAGFQAFTSRAGRVQGGVDRLALGHGDYWAHNLLLCGDGVSAVLDWEGAREDRPATEDLFHFLLTYGLNHRWLGKGRSGPEEAFARTFLQPSPVAEEVARALLRYCTLSGLDRRLLRASFQAHLFDGTSDAGLAPVLLDRLRRSAWSVFDA